MSYTYGLLESATYIKSGTYLKAGSYAEATTYVKAGTTVKAVGGLQLKHFIFKCPTGANSVAVTGISAAMYLQTAYGVKMSAALVKTVANMTTACTLGAGKVIVAAAKALSNAAIHLLVHDPR